MMDSLSDADWPDVERLRDQIGKLDAQTIAGVAQQFSRTFTETFASVVLARVFLVLPFSRLGENERRFARALAKDDARLSDTTPTLTLLGTFGRKPAWCDRTASKGHMAIPLLDRAHVAGIPMIAKLLADLEVDLASLDSGAPIVTRRMLGGRNGVFYVPDAQTARDSQDRFIIPSRTFVEEERVRTVFGMGGAYADGTLAVAVVFLNEPVERITLDRFPSLISNFKMVTSALLDADRIF